MKQIFLEKKLKTDCLPRLLYWQNLERSLWMKVMKVILLPKLMKTPLGYIKFDPKLEWVVKTFWTIFFQFYKRDKESSSNSHSETWIEKKKCCRLVQDRRIIWVQQWIWWVIKKFIKSFFPRWNCWHSQIFHIRIKKHLEYESTILQM